MSHDFRITSIKSSVQAGVTKKNMDVHDKDAPFQWTSFKNALLIVFVVYDTLHIVSMARTKDVDGKSIFNVPVSLPVRFFSSLSTVLFSLRVFLPAMSARTQTNTTSYNHLADACYAASLRDGTCR